MFDYEDREIPQSKKDHTILGIQRIGICGTDLHAFEGTQPYFQYPRVLGHELAAVIEETGAGDFQKGEPVTFIPYLHCGDCIACRNGKTNCCVSLKVCGVHIDGGMTEYFSVPSALLLHCEGLGLDELALVEPLAIGAHAARRANVSSNEFVLVMGAGPIGIGTMEFIRIAGGRVIAMDVNEDRLNVCKEKFGLDHIVHAGKGDEGEQLKEITHGDMPTVVIDATGNLAAINKGFEYMAHGGSYVLVGLQKGNISFSHPEFHKREANLMSSRNATKKDFAYVIDCIKNRLIDPSNYVTHRMAFDQVKEKFAELLNPANRIIKAMINL